MDDREAMHASIVLTDETPLSVTNRRGTIVDGVFHAVPGHEQRMIGEPYHRPFPNDLGDWILNDLPGVLVDNRKHRRDVLAQGFSFCPSSERYRYGVQKRHSPLAVGCDDSISNTRQSDMQLFTLLVQGGLALAQEGCRVVQGLSNLLY